VMRALRGLTRHIHVPDWHSRTSGAETRFILVSDSPG
jgi:hypothetical protein